MPAPYAALKITTRLVMFGLLLAFIIQVAAGYIVRSSSIDGVVVDISIGDPVPELSLELTHPPADWSYDSRDHQPCLALVFYDSRCPACQTHAVAWREAEFTEIADVRIPTLWVGSRSDDEAVDFLDDNELTGGILAVSTFAEFGVGMVPLFYVVGEDGSLVFRTLADPAWIQDQRVTPLELLRETCSPES